MDPYTSAVCREKSDAVPEEKVLLCTLIASNIFWREICCWSESSTDGWRVGGSSTGGAGALWFSFDDFFFWRKTFDRGWRKDSLLFCFSSTLADWSGLSMIGFLRPVRPAVARGESVSPDRCRFVLPVSGWSERSFVSILRSTDAF